MSMVTRHQHHKRAVQSQLALGVLWSDSMNTPSSMFSCVKSICASSLCSSGHFCVHFSQLPMLGKRKKSEPADGSPGVRLRSGIVDLYARGDISSQRCGALLAAAGASNVPACQLHHSTSRARDLQHGLLKTNGWPPLYTCNVPLMHKDGQVRDGPLCFLMPHEVLYSLLEASDYSCITSKEGSMGMCCIQCHTSPTHM